MSRAALRRAWLALALLGLLSAPFAIIGWKKMRAAPVAHLEAVRLGAVESRFFAHGRIGFTLQAKLSAEGLAQVSAILVREGQAVRKGEVLLQLDDSALKDELAQARSRLERSRVELDRLKVEASFRERELQRASELAQKGMVTLAVADQQRWALDNARLQLAAAAAQVKIDEAVVQSKKTQLDRLWVKAPFSGVVQSISIKPGEVAIASAQGIAGSELLHLADPESLAVEVPVSELDLQRVRPGQQARITTAALPGVSFTGRVVDIARRVSQGPGASPAGTSAKDLRSVAVRIRLDRGDPRLIDGLSCDVSLEQASQDNALLVPLAAVQQDEEHPLSSMESMAFGARRTAFVWMASQGRIKRVPVVLGLADDSMQEIREGLKAGDQVLTGPPALLASAKEGMVLPGVSGVAKR